MSDSTEDRSGSAHLVLSVFEGRGLVAGLPSTSGGAAKFVVEGRLGGGFGTCRAPAFEIDSERQPAEINQDLEWVFPRDFQLKWCRSRKVQLQVVVYRVDAAAAAEKLLGSVEFDVAEAATFGGGGGGVDGGRSIARWKTLVPPDDGAEAAEAPVSLLCSLLFENRNLLRDVSMDVGNLTLEKDGLAVPTLDADKGCFALGDESDAARKMYFFNVVIASTSVEPVRENDSFRFSYRLFGNEIVTDSYSAASSFDPELATAKIRTTAESVLRFFALSSDHSPFVVGVVGSREDAAVAEAKVDWARFLSGEIDAAGRLRSGELLVFERVLPVEEVGSGTEIGKVAVLLSLGQRPNSGLQKSSLKINGGQPPGSASSCQRQRDDDDGTITLPPNNEGAEEERRGVTLSLPSVPEGNGRLGSSMDGDSEVFHSRTSHLFSFPVPGSERSVASDDSEASYKFYIHLVSMGIATGREGSSRCRVTFGKSPFQFEEVDTQEFAVETSSSARSLTFSKVDNFRYEIRFVASPRKINHILMTRELTLRVEVAGVPKGHVKVQLSNISDDANEEHKAPIVCSSSGGGVIGEVRYKTSLVRNEARELLVGASLHEKRREAEEELRRWQELEKSDFKKRLKDVEEHHLRTLSSEWSRRLSDCKKEHEAKMESLMAAEKECASCIKVYNAKRLQLAALETRLKAERSQASGEASRLEDELCTLRRENDRLKGAVSRLESENSGLRRENSSLKRDNSRLEAENTRLDGERSRSSGEAARLAAENEELKKTTAANAEQAAVVAATSRSATPLSSTEEARARWPLCPTPAPTVPESRIKAILLKTNVYSEDDYIVKNCDPPTRTSSHF